MNQETIALILQYGLQYGPQVIGAVVNLFSKAPAAPTAQDWADLIAKCSTTARAQMLSVLAANNIDPNSPQGQSFLGLVP